MDDSSKPLTNLSTVPWVPELGPPVAEVKRRSTALLDIYLQGHAELIHADIEARPDHYGESQKDWAHRLRTGQKVPEVRINDLVMQYFRDTAAAKNTRSKVSEATRPKTAKEEAEEIPAFESQEDFKGAIVLI